MSGGAKAFLSAPRVAAAAGAILFGLVAAWHGWVCDDAYISFRTIDNFVNGFGLRWNTAERVQTFTHPLWLFLIAVPYAIVGHIYVVVVVLSVTISAITVWLVSRSFADGWMALWPGLVFSVSPAFVDYATSGLENPLTHLLIACFLIVYFEDRETRRRLFFLCLLTALIGLNRLDALLIVVPPLVAACWRDRARIDFPSILLAFSPLILWLAFSTLYFGTPFPNTAYAKLGGEVPRMALLELGVAYYTASALYDPVAVAVAAAAVAVTILQNRAGTVPVATGLLASGLYLLWIGGDFMAGRFLTPIVLVSVVVVCVHAPDSRSFRRWMVAITVALGLLSTASTGRDVPEAAHLSSPTGTIDERRYYAEYLSVPSVWRNDGEIRHPWAKLGRSLRASSPAVAVRGTVGLAGYFAGPDVHIVDPYGLTDPILARLPASGTNWRPGHFFRSFPDGFVRSVWKRENRIDSTALAGLYDALLLVTRGDLLSRERMRTIFALNLGFYDSALSAERNRVRAYREADWESISDATGLRPDAETGRLIEEMDHLLAAGRAELARVIWKTVDERASGRPDVEARCLPIGSDLLGEGYDLAAIEQLEACDENGSDRGRVHALLAEACFEQGMFAKAGRYARSGAEAAPPDPASIRVLADLSQIYGLWDEAASLYRTLIRIDPGNRYAREELLAIERERRNP